MTRYEYTKVRIDIHVGLFENKPEEDYMDIIQSYAGRGWRFVQAFAPGVGGYGASRWIDLIFEREIQPENPANES